jgi:5,10-methenyltetrahydrofolate synthetase
MDWPSSKPDARKALIRWRNGLSDADRQQRADRLAVAVKQRLLDWQHAVSDGDVRPGKAKAVLGVFWPIRTEPDMRSHYPDWASLGFTLALPVTPAAPGPLTFLEWQPGEAMIADAMGIQVPEQQRSVQTDVLVIPCLGFGDDGLRLGYGGGYYDRTLVSFGGLSIGVALSGSYLASLPAEAHDVRLNCILTDEI